MTPVAAPSPWVRRPSTATGDQVATARARRGSPWVLTTAVAILGLGFGATLATSVTTETWSQLKARGGVALFLGGFTGLAGTYLALIMVLLVSRVPVVERVLGFDGLLRWHRRLAPWPISLIAAHVVLLTLAYAQAARAGIWHEVGTIVGSFPWMIEATIGFLLMMAVAVVSIRAIRRRVRRERWWAFHLCMYLALALAFAHIIVLGPSFVRHPLSRSLWVVFWLATAGMVIAYRFGLPLVRTVRHRLKVVEVRPEGPGVVSVICKGRRLERLAVSGGQFFEWRFLTRGMWWQAHPFSLSARPKPPYLRLTVKDRGDFSAAVASLQPGTRVAIEGPYGVFTSHARRRKKAVLIAGGIGVTAIRALLEDLPNSSEPVVLLRASSEEDLVLSSEVAELARHRRGRAYNLVGSRSAVKLERVVQLVPDLKKRDVYIAGRGLRPLYGGRRRSARYTARCNSFRRVRPRMISLRKTTVTVASTAIGFLVVVAAHITGPRSLAVGSAPPPSTTPTTSSGTTTTGPNTPPTVQLASAVGANEQYGYGVLSVKVTLQGHRIVDLSVANLQTAEQYSQSIAQQVIPVLRQEVLAAQGVRVNAISGATYTTEAYLYSVQSALTKLNF